MSVETLPEVALGTAHIEARTFMLSSLFDKAIQVVPSKDVMPVLRNFQVEASVRSDTGKGTVRISATDLELSVIVLSSVVKVIRPGRVVLPAKKMLEIVKSATGDNLSIDVADRVATVISGSARWTLKLDAGHEYPQLPDVSDVHLYDIDRGKFLQGLHSVRGAAAQPGSRANMAMIDFTNGVMTASDGTRFQQAELGVEFPLSLQIPIGAVDDLIKALRWTDLNTVFVGESEHHVIFKSGDYSFIANKLMAQFPNIEAQLLGSVEHNTDELRTDREQLLAVIARMRINADDETSAIVLKLSRDTVTIEARDKGGNASEETLSASWTEPDRTLVVNWRFLTELLNSYDGATVRLLLGPDKSKTRRSPILLRDGGVTGVVNQMRGDWVLS